MKIGIYYSSQTGNTERLARAIQGALAGRFDTRLADVQECPLPVEDVVFAGFWVDKGVCAARMLDFLGGLEGKRVALFGTAGSPDLKGYYRGILERVEALLPEGCGYLGGFLCQGEMPVSIREHYEEALREDPSHPMARSMLTVYESAIGHPDEDDLRRAAGFARKICAALAP